MRTLSRILLLLLLAVIVAGVGFLATWEMPPPTERMEKVIDNDRFQNR
ncbi:hypothetical protein C882_2122 [Caenispirillum salinarum AK4]|uniref:Uncharacterized protein n=1 Tax=Caenispirillum salinarum AK4 TaxID=1238182 RepID=K9H8F4_9PROT|nr:hypothetical protein [Caenispirillum salinarum]EKV26898.1 hypothetical protein C882_2122 [Caenispirillum salinarum AK4]